jgi:ATP-binding cassette, subfamily B, multidrug efflux pump
MVERQAPNPRRLWWQVIFNHWPIYTAGIFAMLITNGTEVLAPKAIQWMIDAILDASRMGKQSISFESSQAIITAACLFVLIAFIGLLGRVFWRFTLARMTHVAGVTMKRDIWDALRGSSLERVQGFTLGDLMNRAIGDVNSARWIYGFTIVLTCDVIFFTTLGAICMLLIHPGLALTCLSTFIIFPPIIMKLARREYLAHEAAQSELTTLSETVSQSVRGIRAQRASYSFGPWISCLEGSATRYSKLRFKAQSLAINSFPICSIPTAISYTVLFIWGPQLVMTNSMTVGEFAAMASYIYLLQGPVADVGELVAEWQKGFASVSRISEITNAPDTSPNYGLTQNHENVRSPRITVAAHATIKWPASKDLKPIFEVVKLKMRRAERVLFEDISFSLKAGEWFGISGAVGSGKSTLLQGVCGLIPVTQGEIFLRGQKIFSQERQFSSELDKYDVVYAPEKPFVFAGTIRHNLALNCIYSDEQLWQVLDIVCLADEVRRMLSGLDEFVGEGGVTLSGGQRQRLALARILLRATSLVVLDDPLSAVDAMTEAKIIENIKNFLTQQVVIWSSNKVQTLACCHQTARLTSRGLEVTEGWSMSAPVEPSDVHHA